VGCGALGCEFLKSFALMGVGCSERGLVHVTDMDRIELSNLNRQFLFRQKDVGQPKSVAAAAAAKAMNAQLNVLSDETRVGPDTEDHFNDIFWNSLTGVCNALDNLEARRYTDSRCVFFEKPLLESGTMGTKAHSEIVVPHLTASYSEQKDNAPAGGIPMCTLRNFPHLIEHCIEWALAKFSDYFVDPAKVGKTAECVLRDVQVCFECVLSVCV
jgi:ubiquitin-activating enzyme E1